MNIDQLTTIAEARAIAAMFAAVPASAPMAKPGLSSMIGQKVIVRTYSAGVHFGELVDKAGDEVILKGARRLWGWHTNEGICTHGIARGGVDHKRSRICAPVESLWVQATEIIPCTPQAIASIESSPYAKPE